MRRRALVLLASGFALAACSSGGSSGSGSGGGTSGGSGGAGGSAASGSGEGWVTAGSETFMEGGQNISISSLSASFRAQGQAQPTGWICTDQTIGDCVVSSCDVDTADAGTASYPQAGAITLSGGTGTATITPDANGVYADVNKPGSTLWAGGETLSVQAAGGDVPAFSGTITAPSQLTITSPALVTGNSWPIPRSSDFAMTWTGDSAGQLTVTIRAFTNGNQHRTDATCRFAAATHAGSIPASVLGQLPAGSGAIVALVASDQAIAAGGWTVHVQALSGAVDPTGAAYAEANVVLQ